MPTQPYLDSDTDGDREPASTRTSSDVDQLRSNPSPAPSRVTPAATESQSNKASPEVERATPTASEHHSNSALHDASRADTGAIDESHEEELEHKFHPWPEVVVDFRSACSIPGLSNKEIILTNVRTMVSVRLLLLHIHSVQAALNIVCCYEDFKSASWVNLHPAIKRRLRDAVSAVLYHAFEY